VFDPFGDFDTEGCLSKRKLAATAVTKLAGDEVKSDPTDDLLVALTRAGKLSPREMTKLVIAHHRNLASV